MTDEHFAFHRLWSMIVFMFCMSEVRPPGMLFQGEYVASNEETCSLSTEVRQFHFDSANTLAQQAENPGNADNHTFGDGCAN